MNSTYGRIVRNNLSRLYRDPPGDRHPYCRPQRGKPRGGGPKPVHKEHTVLMAVNSIQMPATTKNTPAAILI